MARMLRKTIFLVVFLIALTGVGKVAYGQEVMGCGSLENAFGPFDYRDPANQKNLRMVESHHFTSQVEMLKRGQSGALNADLDYTLRAFPNHPRALNSMAKYALLGGRMSNVNIPSADCYFKRAIVFRADDETVRIVYANYLSKRKQLDLARKEYEEALRLAPESAEVNYDAGLFYVSQGDLVRAKQLAAVAYANGYPLPGLRNMIAEAEASAGRRN